MTRGKNVTAVFPVRKGRGRPRLAAPATPAERQRKHRALIKTANARRALKRIGAITDSGALMPLDVMLHCMSRHYREALAIEAAPGELLSAEKPRRAAKS
jgi:hypothetical protein